MDNTRYEQLLYYLETLEYPISATSQEANYIRVNFKHYFSQEHKLYRKAPLRLVLRLPDAINAFQMYHNHPMGGHYAFKNTYSKISAKYYWDGMIQNIKDWVSSCERCQQKGKELELDQPHVIPVPPGPFQQVSMDIKHVQSSRGGHRYIIVAIDYFSKWVEAKALTHANSIEVMIFFVEDVISRHSTPSTLITDNGSPFSNLLINTLCNDFGIKHKFSSAYHPQGNGLVERFNRTLGSCLRKLPVEEKPDWHLYLPVILFSYRCIIQASIKLSPFELLYGRQPRTPFDNFMGNPGDLDEELNEEMILNNFTIFREKLIQVQQTAVTNINKAQESQLKMVNKRILSNKKTDKPPYQLGDLVLKYQDLIANNLSAKLEDRYEGPYIIHECFPNSTYQLKKINGEIQPRHVHGNKLKIYKMPKVIFNPSYFNSTVNTHNESNGEHLRHHSLSRPQTTYLFREYNHGPRHSRNASE